MRGILNLAPTKKPAPKDRPICACCQRPRSETQNRIHPIENKPARLCLNCYGDLRTLERLKRSNQTSIAETALNICMVQAEKV